MPDDNFFRWLALGGLLLFYILFAASETSLFALQPLDRLRLKQRHPHRGKLVEDLLGQSHRLLVTLIFGVEIVTILASIVATSLALSLWGELGKWLALLVMSPTLLLLGEIIPKSVALTYPAALAPLMAPFIRGAMVLLSPFRLVLWQISQGLLVTFGFHPELEVPAVKQDDFVRMVEESHRGGMIAALEREFIQNFLHLGDIRVSTIMVPRPDIFALPVDLPLSQMVSEVKRSRFSRIPVYEGRPGNIQGILPAKELLYGAPSSHGDTDFIRHILRPPFYVPENKKAFDLLTEMQTQRQRLALVVDEYGSLVGLVTIEDILEELCGEIPQEYQQEDRPVQELAPGHWRVKGSLPLEEFNEIVGASLPSGEIDTLGGFVLDLFGELPREGDTALYESLEFKVAKIKGTRILELEVRQVLS